MRTYERVFLHVKPYFQQQENGHAQRNIENKKSLAIAKKEIENMLGAVQNDNK